MVIENSQCLLEVTFVLVASLVAWSVSRHCWSLPCSGDKTGSTCVPGFNSSTVHHLEFQC